MEKIIQYLIPSICLITMFIVVGCSDSPSGVEPVDLTVEVAFDESYGSQAASGVIVTMTNVTSQQSYENTTDDEGQVLFEDLPSGSYDIMAEINLSPQEVLELTGTLPNEGEVVFNASLTDVLINADTDLQEIALTTGRLGDLVLKQVYYAGSDVVDGAVFRDQFIEIYNNSDETIYLDGLYIMGAYGNNSAGDTQYMTEDGQFDWNQSLGMPAGIDANNDYLYTRWLYQIPDEGNSWPLEPGESAVIAQTALNHKEPYTDQNGETVSVNDPSLTVDLSNADFEVYLGDEFDKPFKTDIDNPDVPNLRNIFIFGRDLLLDTKGRDAFAIFRSEVDGSELDAYPDPESREITDGTTFYPQIPVEWIIDAVETQPSPTNQIPRKLPGELEASYTYVPGGKYSSNSIIRLVSEQVGGRTVLKDTNNSTEDFAFLERAKPHVSAPETSNKAHYRAPLNREPGPDVFDNFKSRWAPSLNRR